MGIQSQYALSEGEGLVYASVLPVCDNAYIYHEDCDNT